MASPVVPSAKGRPCSASGEAWPASVWPGCAPHTRAEELADSAPWKAGTYTTEVTGHNAPYTMTVTFSDDAITAIDTSANQESLGVGADALKALQQQAIDNQTINLDAVTGATLSSLSLQTGLEDCAKQAQAFEVLSEAPAPEKPAVEEVYDADVCVVGGGGSGLAAAIAAVQAGASVIVLEKCGITGGSTNVSEGALNAVDPERQEPQGIEDSIPTFYETTMKGGHNTNNPELVHFLTDNALDSVHWLESLGVEFKDEIGSATGSLGQRSHYPATPSGNTYIRSFQQFIDDNADAIMLLNNMQAKELILDDAGAVVGVKALYDGEQEVTVNCGAVVIATGGFGGNVEYRQKVNTGVWKEVVLDDSIGCTNIKPCAQGEGMVLAENAGAELICLSDIQLHPCGTPGTGLMEDIRTSGRNRIFVNTDGKRFVNEGAERDVLCKNIFAQPDGTYWIVVNTLRYPDPDEPDANGATINNMLALGHIVAGDTVEALAGEMGRGRREPAGFHRRLQRRGGRRHRRVRLRGRQHRRCGHDRGPLVRLPQGAHRAPHHGRHPRECGIRGLQRRRRADSRLVRRRRVHRRHPRREPPGRQRHRRLHDLRPQRRHQRRKVRPGLAAL